MQIRCPSCNTKTTWQENPFRPFCSERCKLVDLGKWAAEEYRIESSTQDEDQESNSQVIHDPQKEGEER
ncbi:MAG: DNA gyrase inhibitor YacG [Nitrospiraceae bacterium]|nr:DNA gyrase inhibitor YacG [Nitrospiraceae bacterium]